jgi:hypothetical protein
VRLADSVFQRLKRKTEATEKTVNHELATPGRQQIRCRCACGPRFDLKLKTEAVRKQDCRPAKKPIPCSNHKSKPLCEIDGKTELAFKGKEARLKEEGGVAKW